MLVIAVAEGKVRTIHIDPSFFLQRSKRPEFILYQLNEKAMRKPEIEERTETLITDMRAVVV